MLFRSELFLLNADYLTEQISVITGNLTELQRLIATADADGLRTMLRAGREMKEALEKAR